MKIHINRYAYKCTGQKCRIFLYRKVLAWENKPKTAGIYVGFMLGVYFLEPWMITLGLVIPFLKNIVVSTQLKSYAASEKSERNQNNYFWCYNFY